MSRDRQEVKEQLVLKGLQEILVLKVQREHKGQPAHKAQRERKGLLGFKELRVRRVLPAHKALQEILVQQALRVLLGQQVRQPQEQLVQLDQLE